MTSGSNPFNSRNSSGATLFYSAARYETNVSLKDLSPPWAVRGENHALPIQFIQTWKLECCWEYGVMCWGHCTDGGEFKSSSRDKPPALREMLTFLS